MRKARGRYKIVFLRFITSNIGYKKMENKTDWEIQEAIKPRLRKVMVGEDVVDELLKYISGSELQDLVSDVEDAEQNGW